MSWLNEQKDKIEVASSLLITVIIDILLLITVSFLLHKSKFLLENFIFNSKIDKIDPISVTIYYISKAVIFCGFLIYAVNDIISHIIITYKKIKNHE